MADSSRSIERDVDKAESKLSSAAHDTKHAAEKTAKDTKHAAKDAARDVKSSAKDAKDSFPTVDQVKRDVSDLTSGKQLKEHQKKNLLKAGGALLAGILGVTLVIVGGTAAIKKIKHKDPEDETRDWFGRRKRDAENVADDVKGKLNKAGDTLGDKFGHAKRVASGKADDVSSSSKEAADKVKREAQKAGEKTEHGAVKASEKSDNIVKKAADATAAGAKSVASKTKHAAQDVTSSTKDAAGSAKHKTGNFFDDVKGWFGERKDEFADSAHKGRHAQAAH